MRRTSKFAHCAAINPNLSALVDSKRSTRQLFRERPGPCPLGHLAAEAEQLGPLRRTQRFTTRSFQGLHGLTLVAHPLLQGVLGHRQLARDLSDRSSGVDDAMRCFDPNSSVNRLLVAPTVTSFQPTLESAYRVSTFSGEPQCRCPRRLLASWAKPATCWLSGPEGAAPRYQLWIRVEPAGFSRQVVDTATKHSAGSLHHLNREHQCAHSDRGPGR